MTRHAIFAVIAFVCVAETAAAQGIACTDLAPFKATLVGKGATWIDLTPDQWQFVRGVISEAPDTPVALPPHQRYQSISRFSSRKMAFSSPPYARGRIFAAVQHHRCRRGLPWLQQSDRYSGPVV